MPRLYPLGRGVLAALVAVCTAVVIPRPAAAQEAPVWRFRVGAGVLFSGSKATSPESGRTVSLHSTAPVFTVDAIRTFDHSVELFITGLLPSIAADIERDVAVTRYTPVGVHLGMNYRWRSEKDLKFYTGAFLAAFTHDRVVAQSGAPAGATLSDSYGIGVNFSVSKVLRRRRLPDDEKVSPQVTRDEWIVADAGFRWQRAHPLSGEFGKIAWNPIVLTGGIAIHLW